MRANNPIQGTTGSGRPTVPKGLLRPFKFDESNSVKGKCLPLTWKRETYLPPERSLEAWYFLPEGSGDTEWRTDPREIMANEESYPQLAPFIFNASIEPDAGKHRLACAGLITDLGKRSGKLVWIMPEPQSISIWSDAAFQIWHYELVT
jgi:hypothetical protein